MAGSVGHGGSPFLDGSRGPWVAANDPLAHDDEITDRSSLQFLIYYLGLVLTRSISPIIMAVA